MGRLVVLTKSIFLALASLLFFFFKQLHIGIMIVGYEIDFESPICKLGNTLY